MALALLGAEISHEIAYPLNFFRHLLGQADRGQPLHSEDKMVGTSPAIQRLLSVVRRVALSDRPALITGPTGSGKELVARALHLLGPFPDEPLLDLNCGAIPEQLMESQLFGHERGAFTGADRRQEGLMTVARRGTLFLDEIAELPLGLQAKLLRVLETGLFRPIGATAESTFKGRIVAATHANLEERREDIPALLAHFTRQQSRPLQFSEEAVNALMYASWPGNVRQLRNLVDRLAVFADEDVVTPETLAAPPGQGRREQHVEDPVKVLARAILRMPEAGDKQERRRAAVGGAPQGHRAPAGEPAWRGRGRTHPRESRSTNSPTGRHPSRRRSRMRPSSAARDALSVMTEP